jgi:hypothetical protein
MIVIDAKFATTAGHFRLTNGAAIVLRFESYSELGQGDAELVLVLVVSHFVRMRVGPFLRSSDVFCAVVLAPPPGRFSIADLTLGLVFDVVSLAPAHESKIRTPKRLET